MFGLFQSSSLEVPRARAPLGRRAVARAELRGRSAEPLGRAGAPPIGRAEVALFDPFVVAALVTGTLRSRLYRSRFLQPNVRVAAFLNLYTILHNMSILIL